ncbi:unnamed protein product [Bursaphelenchus xylophilus]|uniref:(pine wood nematode) hypothetical protein n=1 Tax=Bursaphelenchus xylophilus TaxID=6326 RepID=A0A1I7RU80_BURXY|nr:unnamed protein product [Bursaphelenchus xylophilus]CAG9113906.1 unnamed protein product [Bursaphelenchus xylophilus]
MRRCLRCRTSNHCRRHGHIRLVTKHYLEKVMWINEHVHNHYRPMDLPVELCIRSVFQLNNETVNIWSHLFGFFYFLHMQYRVNYQVLPSLNAPQMDYIVQTLSLFGAQLCMILSAAYHTFGCINEYERNKWLRMDIFGISAGLLGMYLGGIYTSFYCFNNALQTYLSALSGIFALALYIPAKHDSISSKIRGTRIGYLHLTYMAITSFGLYPTFHWVQLHGGFGNSHVSTWFPSIVVMFGLVGLGFVFYATLIPERFYPGKFDLVGCSHQWWHLLILAAMIYWNEAGIQLLTYYHSMPRLCSHLDQDFNTVRIFNSTHAEL